MYFGMSLTPSATDAFVSPEGARVELVKKNNKDWFGDAYYFYQDSERENQLLIAPSLTMENQGVTNSFDSVFYTDAILSPDGRWVALPATCWEETCLRIYDVKRQSLHWADRAAMNVSWSTDGRLHAEGDCAAPKVTACGPFESTSANEPWRMQSVK